MSPALLTSDVSLGAGLVLDHCEAPPNEHEYMMFIACIIRSVHHQRWSRPVPGGKTEFRLYLSLKCHRLEETSEITFNCSKNERLNVEELLNMHRAFGRRPIGIITYTEVVSGHARLTPTNRKTLEDNQGVG